LISHKVKVNKKIFLSPETGFGVFKVSIKGTRENKIITGNLFDVKSGDFLEIKGEYFYHPRFGEQIKVITFEFIKPQDNEGIKKFLSSGRFKGVGEKTAEKIVNVFGQSTFEILEENPEKLNEINGVKKAVITEIKKNIRENKTIRDLTAKLSPFGIGTETIFKIFREFEDNAFEVLENNPYLLIDRIRGIGFKIADTVARGFGLNKNDPNRISAGIDFQISQNEQKNGDLWIDENELLEKSSYILDVDTDEIIESIENKIKRNELRREGIPQQIIMSYKNYLIEKMNAKLLFDYATTVSSSDKIEVNFEELYDKLSMRLTKEQEKAIISALNINLTIITGGPGTGKTTIIRAIIESLKINNKRFLIAAPTGRAAKRIEETSFYSASTIHRMLKIKPETQNFVHNEHNPLIADVIIIDEFSMVDSFLLYSLLKAISRGTKLIIIGDKDQLPSVGPGNILRDMIESNYFNIIYLSRNFRQTENSLIIENAHRINRGEHLILKAYNENLDFVFINISNEQQAKEKLLGIIDFFKDEFSITSTEFQILIPMYKGDVGIDNVNKMIQEKFNPESSFIKKEKISLKKMDKVMQLRNNYEKEIFNGEQGIVADFNESKRILVVDYEGYFVEYDLEEMDELSLSYAVSIHKSQGSEYDIVILVLLPSHSRMLNREIFYTAVSRAKKRIFLISDEITIQRALLNSTPHQRKTMLPIRLKEYFETPINENQF